MPIPSSSPAYAELHCLSNFTFLRGASHPEELVARAAELGYRALAITDECSLSGIVRAHSAAKDAGLKLLVGTEVALADGPRLVILAMDREGYARLSAMISQARRAAAKGQYHLCRQDLADGLPGCLVLMLPAQGDTDSEAGCWVAGRFPQRAWLAVELLHGRDDAACLDDCITLSVTTGLPMVACGDVHMHRRARRALQDTLTAIRLNTPLAALGQRLAANGERHLRPRRVLAGIYPAALLHEAVHIASLCAFSLEVLRYEYPQELVPKGYAAPAYLRELTETGMQRRYPAGVPGRVRQQVNHELALIRELAYEPYFLTVHDIVRFARAAGILCQGRGSAANSAVCYCLGITEVDPARMAMLFERFISRERNEPPDIDVDFEHERREEVIQYIYEKYGRERAALAAALITYRPRSAIRDVGKALGLPSAQIDQLARSMHWWDGKRLVNEKLVEMGFAADNPVLERLAVLVGLLVGFPRHLSQHVGGFVIAKDALSRLVPVENAAMPERTVIQWDKNDLEALGLLKVDVLALGMLTAIHRCLDLMYMLRQGRSPAGRGGERGVDNFTLADIPAEDPATYAMIQQADTVGVFQIESRAQMAMLPRLRPARFYDLVIEVAIVRPGPIQGGMVHPYLRRRNGEEAISYPSEAVREVLKRTLGVPIFQEQVMKLAVVAAGFTPGEADQLRRSMAAWRRRGGLAPFRDRLLAGMRENGYDEAFAERIFKQIQGFGEYGFPESHAASFALLVYISCWLKCHEPAAFTCALLNSQPMGFYQPAQLVQDARRHGVTVLPVHANLSTWDCTLEADAQGVWCLRLGLRMVKGLSRAGADRLVAARATGGYVSVPELAARAALDKGDLQALAAADALQKLAGHRRAAYWQVLGVEQAPGLWQGQRLPVTFAEPQAALPAPSEAQDLVADYAATGLSLGRHPLALLRRQFARRRMLRAADLLQVPHGRLVRTAGLVVNRQRPHTAAGVTFMTLEDETGSINLVVWQAVAEAQRRIMLSARLLAVAGIIEREGSVVHLVAGRLEDYSAMIGDLQARSRDFR